LLGGDVFVVMTIQTTVG